MYKKFGLDHLRRNFFFIEEVFRVLLNILTFTSQFMTHSCGGELSDDTIRIELGEVVDNIYYRVIEEVNGDDDELLLCT